MIRIDMLQLLRVAQARHHEAEKRLPPHDWTVWYAAFIESSITDGTYSPTSPELFADEAVHLELAKQASTAESVAAFQGDGLDSAERADQQRQIDKFTPADDSEVQS